MRRVRYQIGGEQLPQAAAPSVVEDDAGWLRVAAASRAARASAAAAALLSTQAARAAVRDAPELPQAAPPPAIVEDAGWTPRRPAPPAPARRALLRDQGELVARGVPEDGTWRPPRPRPPLPPVRLRLAGDERPTPPPAGSVVEDQGWRPLLRRWAEPRARWRYLGGADEAPPPERADGFAFVLLEVDPSETSVRFDEAEATLAVEGPAELRVDEHEAAAAFADTDPGVEFDP